MGRADTPLLISTAPRIRIVASPVRAAVVDALEVLGPATIVSLGRALGYPPDGLYYHLRALERHGLVARAGTDKTSGAVTFDLPGRPATLGYRLSDPNRRDATAKVVRTMVRSAERSFHRAYGPGRARIEGPLRNLRAGRRTAWLAPGQLAALNRCIERIHTLFAQGRPGRAGAELHEFTYVLAPIVPKRRRSS